MRDFRAIGVFCVYLPENERGSSRRVPVIPKIKTRQVVAHDEAAFESSQLFGSNAPFIEELYENYLDNPDSVSDEWRSYFDSMQNLPVQARRRRPLSDHQRVCRDGSVARFARGGCGQQSEAGQRSPADQRLTALAPLAQLDPLKRTERPEIHELELSHYGFTGPI